MALINREIHNSKKKIQKFFFERPLWAFKLNAKKTPLLGNSFFAFDKIVNKDLSCQDYSNFDYSEKLMKLNWKVFLLVEFFAERISSLEFVGKNLKMLAIFWKEREKVLWAVFLLNGFSFPKKQKKGWKEA